MWNTREIEQQLALKLEKELGKDEGAARFACYMAAREKVVLNIADEFKAAEPELSDHSARHIADVLDRAGHLLTDIRQDGERHISCLTGLELYLLCMTIVFHDVGNMFGRRDHQLHVGGVYDWARGNDPAVRRERSLVLAATRAHTGTTAAGSRDTLASIEDEDLDGKRIRLRDLAAVLRLADELAEGPQRTSGYKLTKKMYGDSSVIYHRYAAITHPFVDRGTQRVRLTYEVDVSDVTRAKRSQRRLRDLLQFTYTRAVKLDQERRYARYYSALLPFRETSVVLNFHTASGTLNLGLQPLVFDDKVVPGDRSMSIPTVSQAYAVGRLINRIVHRLG